MKLLGKCISFVKENKIIVCALAIVLLSFVFLALPGQFAHYGVDGFVKNHYTFKHKLNGYQWFFNSYTYGPSSVKLGAKAPAQGIAIFVMLILCVPGLLFSKKSSFVALLTSLTLVTVAILFFTISAAGLKAYPAWHIPEKDHKYILMGWVPYLLGSFIMLAGLAMSYRTFLVLKAEAKAPIQPKGGPSYSYLKK